MLLRQRNVVDNMLLTHCHMLLMLQLAATCFPCASTFTLATSAASTLAHADKHGLRNATPTVAAAATATAPASLDGIAIGATSLAAAAGAAAAMSADLSAAARSRTGHSTNDQLIANSANLLLENLQPTTGHVVNLTRQHEGDVFRTNGVTKCDADTCVGLSSGTAGQLSSVGGGSNNDKPQHAGAVGTLAGSSNGQRELLLRTTAKGAGAAVGESCECRCLSYLSTYREDLGICVDDVHECTLSPFVSGSTSEKIPFVFLPLRGQIIYPSREISFPDIRTPVCAVTGAQYMTANGWSDLRNPIDTDYPFRMFRDEGRTFLQWLGEPDLRHKMQGRLIVVHLVCRDMTLMLNASSKEHVMPPKNVFSPCVAFRVNGSPVKFFHNVSEVLFQSETTSTLASTSDGMTTKEYVVIGVCSLLLGLIYVSSVFLYLHMKKRKGRDQHHMRSSLDDLANEINYPKNDQVTFGAPFNRNGSIYSATSLTTSNEPRSRASIGSLKEEMGIVKSNPLLQHFPQLSEHHSGFASDISNSNSECEMDSGGGCGGAGSSFHDKLKQLQTSALVHPPLSGNGSSSGTHSSANGKASDEEPMESSSSPTQEKECLPAENVSIVEDMLTEERLENLRAMVNGNVRKKLYFNPAYFEPHLLVQPPPAAVEFLQKIREVIAIAKYKMATKRYQPSLIMIPEESALRSSTSSLHDAQAQGSAECQGCANNRCSGHVKNCGDKRNSIEKWLQSVQTREEEAQRAAQNAGRLNEQQQQMPSPRSGEDRKQPQRNGSPSTKGGSRCSPRREITPPKQRPPPPPTPTATGKCNSYAQQQAASVIEIRAQREDGTAVYQHYRAKTSDGGGNSLSIPINRNYECFSALSAAANIYGFAETGTEIYNNPKFTLHDSPPASQRSNGSSKCSRKRLDVLDQYAAASTPNSLTSADRQHYEMLRSMQQQHSPDRLPTCDANGTLRSNGSYQLDIPTPDYDSTMEKTFKEIYNSTHSSAPSVPTPDYSTLSRNSLKQCQPPDSPIYRRKSPQYLIVDYETDSLERLERLEVTKRKSSQSSSSPSSDVSSQLSPSLSTALPLEEELEISHTVYNNKVDGFRKEGELKQKLLAKSNSGATHKDKDLAARIKYDTPFRGSMTIEVEHEPPSDMERSTDSDQFEPDTLERKFKKQSFCDVSAWSVQQQQQQSESRLYSLPDMSRCQGDDGKRSPFMLRTSNSFRSPSGGNSPTYESHVQLREQHDEADEARPSFSSLRQLYQSPLERQHSQQGCKCGGQARLQLQQNFDELSEQGRLLTLEAKHSRRQRIMASPSPPAVVEITKVPNNKTTIKISTPKEERAAQPATSEVEPAPQHDSDSAHASPASKKKKVNSPRSPHAAKNAVANSNSVKSGRALSRSPSKTPVLQPKRAPRASPPPLPPAPPSSTHSTLRNWQQSNGSNKHCANAPLQPHYQNHGQYMQRSATATATEDDTLSNHSESTAFTGVSAPSEFGGSCNNTLSSAAQPAHDYEKRNGGCGESHEIRADSRGSSVHGKLPPGKQMQSPEAIKKDYGAMFNTQINGLRSDYSLTKYMNRRKTHSPDADAQLEREANNNNSNSAKNAEQELSFSSRSNHSSSGRLSDRTKEMYRNAGVPVGIAYPQRSSAGGAGGGAVSGGSNSASTTGTTVQTVYRCEIEPVQLTHGMQIAMGLKDRAKKAKDLKNAWRKFVSMAASKFSPTHSPAPPYDKKTPSFMEVLDRDEGISSLIEEHPQVSTPKSSYSAPASQNYYEQRFGVRPQEMDSGYMSADSGEMYKRSFYDRYNFRMMSGRDHIIRVDTIEDNSDAGDSTGRAEAHSSITDSNRFEDFEHLGEPPAHELVREDSQVQLEAEADDSDADSDKTLTHSSNERTAISRSRHTGELSAYSSEDERGQSASYGSSETDGETTNAEDMWESGAESIETHSVLYKNVRHT